MQQSTALNRKKQLTAPRVPTTCMRSHARWQRTPPAPAPSVLWPSPPLPPAAASRQSTATPDRISQPGGGGTPVREAPGNGLPPLTEEHRLSSVGNSGPALRRKGGPGLGPGVQPDGSQLMVPGPSNLEEFVSHLRNASPYIEGHRGRTFVLVIPGEVGAAMCLRLQPAIWCLS